MNRFWFLPVLGLKIHNNRVGMSNNSRICLPYWKSWTNYFWSWTKVDRIYLAVNMAVSLFPKWYKNTGILSKQANPKNRIFVVLYCLLYCLFIPLGITRAYSFRLAPYCAVRKAVQCAPFADGLPGCADSGQVERAVPASTAWACMCPQGPTRQPHSE